MPPYAEWCDWFGHVWTTAFLSEDEGRRRYYYFANYTLQTVCYRFGRAAAKRLIPATASSDAQVSAAQGFLDLGLPDYNLDSGNFMFKFIITVLEIKQAIFYC